MTTRQIFLLFVVYFFIPMSTSCSDMSSCAVDGDNEKELRKVLEHYSNDKLKFNAARYLIENIKFHQSYAIDSYKAYCEAIDSLFLLNKDEKTLAIEANVIIKKYAKQIKLQNDVEVISSSYLISHIDDAFKQWENSPFLQHLDFDDFCEYVLPYKCVEGQMLDNWRQYSKIAWPIDTMLLNQITLLRDNARYAYMYVHDYVVKNSNEKSYAHLDIIPVYNPNVILHAPYADCYEKAVMELMYCRANGVPASIDYVPNWTNLGGVHYWINILNTSRTNEAFEPLDPNEAYPGYFKKNGYRMPKVYRFSWKPREILRDALEDGIKLPYSLSNPFVKDVTTEYCRTINLSVRTNSDIQYLYLAVFDNHNWVPVDVARNRNGRLSFSDVGVGGVYCVVACENERCRQIAAPFEIKTNGEIETFPQSLREYGNVTMTRKYPLSVNLYAIREYLTGGVVLASNSSDFSRTDKLCDFTDYYPITGNVTVKSNIPYRYIRLSTEDSQVSDFAEIYFFDKENKRVYPKIISDRTRISRYINPMNICDNDLLTYTRISDNNIIDFDFGTPVCLSKIIYSRRGDGNDIIPGDIYELYYNDGMKWILHQTITAEDIEIEFKDVPKDVLLYIRCVNRGQQNRIFTYDTKVSWY